MNSMRRALEGVPDWLKGRTMAPSEFKAALSERLDKSPCPYQVCDGSGDVPALMSIDGVSSKGLRRCRCLLDRQLQQSYEALMRAGNMDAYKHMTFEAAINHTHQADAVRIMSPETDGFYIFGPVGGGKTYLLASSVNKEIAAGRPAALITVPQLLAACQEVKGGISDLERQACRVPYLALDDIGKEKLDGFRASEARNMLFRLMDARSLLHDRGLGFTSFSSQWPRDKMEGTISLGDAGQDSAGKPIPPAVDPAVVSRIRGMTMMIYLNGPDLRAGR